MLKLNLCYAQQMPFKRREPDAIDRCFALQRRAWWKKWKWLIVGFALIVAWQSLNFSYYPGYDWVFGFPPSLNSPCFISQTALDSYTLWQGFHYYLHDCLVIPIALVSLTLAGSCTSPKELIAAVGFNSFIRRKRQLIRKAIWLMFAITYFCPMAVIVFFPELWGIDGIPIFLILICWLVVFFAISEWVVFITTKQLSNWAIGIGTCGVIVLFIGFRLYLEARMQDYWDSWSRMGIEGIPVYWIVLKPIAIAALVSLVALVFLVRANKAPAEYLAEG